jgi:trk system potassium uptake protein TrkA
MGERVAHTLVTGGFIDILELDTDHMIVEVDVLHIWEGKTLEQLDLRAVYGINVIAIRSFDILNASPLASDMIKPGDKIIVMGESKSINELNKLSKKDNQN